MLPRLPLLTLRVGDNAATFRGSHWFYPMLWTPRSRFRHSRTPASSPRLDSAPTAGLGSPGSAARDFAVSQRHRRSSTHSVVRHDSVLSPHAISAHHNVLEPGLAPIGALMPLTSILAIWRLHDDKAASRRIRRHYATPGHVHARFRHVRTPARRARATPGGLCSHEGLRPLHDFCVIQR